MQFNDGANGCNARGSHNKAGGELHVAHDAGSRTSTVRPPHVVLNDLVPLTLNVRCRVSGFARSVAESPCSHRSRKVTSSATDSSPARAGAGTYQTRTIRSSSSIVSRTSIHASPGPPAMRPESPCLGGIGRTFSMGACFFAATWGLGVELLSGPAQRAVLIAK